MGLFLSPPNTITSSRLARGNNKKKKKELGDNIKLVENLRLNKRHLVGWEILIKSIRKNDST